MWLSVNAIFTFFLFSFGRSGLSFFGLKGAVTHKMGHQMVYWKLASSEEQATEEEEAEEEDIEEDENRAKRRKAQ